MCALPELAHSKEHKEQQKVIHRKITNIVESSIYIVNNSYCTAYTVWIMEVLWNVPISKQTSLHKQCIYTYILTYTHVFTYLHIYTHTYKSMHIYIYTRKHTYTHAYLTYFLETP